MVSVGSFRTLTQAPGKALGQAVTLNASTTKSTKARVLEGSSVRFA